MSTAISPISEIFLSNLQQIQDRISNAERELSSGLRVSVASDAPDKISTILQLRTQIAGVQQTQENLSTVSPLVSSAGDAIQQAIQVLDTATTLASEGASSNVSESQRQALAQQAQAALQQLVSLSQTSVNGTYVFSGDQPSSPTYSVNLANGNGVDQVTQPGPPGQIEDANGIKFSVGLTAQQVFDDRNEDGSYANDNVFAAMTGLVTALQSNKTADIQAAVTTLQAASSYLNEQAGFYGAAQNAISNASNAASHTLTQLQQQLSTEQDADAVQASLDLQTALTAQQAALAAQAQNKPQSLFDYLS